MNDEIKKIFLQFIQEIDNGNSTKFIYENIDRIIEIIDEVSNIYSQYPKWIFLDKIIDGSSSIMVIGDLHADYLSLKKIIKIKLESPETVLIFLGDYVDRGSFSNEVLILVILLNLIFPSTIFLLPGNHELYHYFNYQNPQFWNQMGKISLIFEPIKSLMENIPLILSFNKILFIHGGMFDYDFKKNKDKEFVFKMQNNIELKLKDFLNLDNNKIFDIVWADYVDNYDDKIYSISLGRPVKTGKDIKKLQNDLKINLIIRGHQPSLKGISFDEKVITLLTSSIYSMYGNIKGTLVVYIKKSNEKNIEYENCIKKIVIDDYEVIILNLEEY